MSRTLVIILIVLLWGATLVVLLFSTVFNLDFVVCFAAFAFAISAILLLNVRKVAHLRFTRREFLGLFLVTVSLTHIILHLVDMPLFVGYYGIQQHTLFYFPKALPLAIIGFFCLLPNPNGRRLAFPCWLVFCGATAIAFFVTINYVAFGNTIMETLTGVFDWTGAGWLTWNYAFSFTFLTSYAKTHNPLFSFTFASVGISAGGQIYELPAYPFLADPWNGAYLHRTYPLLLNTQWFTMVFLIFLCRKHGWKPKIWHLPLAATYTLFALLALVQSQPWPEWLIHTVRLPTAAILTTLPLSFTRNAK